MSRPLGPPYYEFVPVDGTRRVAVFDRLFTPRNKFSHLNVLQLVLVTKSEIHVGSGLKAMQIVQGNPRPRLQALRNASGALHIPGSTLKGVTSTNYLALSGSIEETSECFGATQLGGRGAHAPLISKVFFSDAVPESPVQPVYVQVRRAWTPKVSRPRHVKVYTALAPPTALYGEAECIPKGTKLRTMIEGIELREHELGGLLMALGLAPTQDAMIVRPMKVGYGKPQGLGRAQVDPEQSVMNRLEVDRLTTKDAGPHKLSSVACIQLANTFVAEGNKRRRDVMAFWQKLFKPEIGENP